MKYCKILRKKIDDADVAECFDEHAISKEAVARLPSGFRSLEVLQLLPFVMWRVLKPEDFAAGIWVLRTTLLNGNLMIYGRNPRLYECDPPSGPNPYGNTLLEASTRPALTSIFRRMPAAEYIIFRNGMLWFKARSDLKNGEIVVNVEMPNQVVVE